MSHTHVYTVASGFGLRVVPGAAPYRFSLAPVPPAIDVERAVGERWLFARVVPDRKGGYRVELDEHTPSLADVLDVGAGPDREGWWAETSAYRIPLLEGWTLQAGGEPGAPSPFDLLGPNGTLLYLQAASRVPALAELAAPGQEVVASGEGPRSQWVEVQYVHGGEPWAQRHHLMRAGPGALVLTAQGRVPHMPAAVRAQEALVAALEPTGPP